MDAASTTDISPANPTDISVSTHYIDLLCATADDMAARGLTPQQMVAAMQFIAAAYSENEENDGRIRPQ